MPTRRHFLKGSAAACAGAASVLGTLSARNAWAADTSGYKAIVCVLLLGGIDHADTILPVDQASFDELANLRVGLFNAHGVGSGNSSRDRENILPLNATNAGAFGARRFGLPVQMVEMRDMFDNGDLAILGNVGPLIEPTNRTNFADGSVELPTSLFSHNDQQSSWMALGGEGTTIGWGGRFADAIIAADPSSDPIFTAITAGNNGVFLAGEEARAFRAVSTSAQAELILRRGSVLRTSSSNRNAALAEFNRLLRNGDFGHDGLMEQDFSEITQRGSENIQTFASALDSTLGSSLEFPSTGIGNQLSAVARTISTRNILSVNRQVFYVTMGGFDTHSGQASTLPNLQRQLSEALSVFRQALINEGVWNDVTTFTASDFGRTLGDNGDGTDHGWGGHQFIMGGDVNGQRIYGDLPAADPDSEFHTESRPRLIPTTSVEQYAATLGTWFGLNTQELNRALPNLGNFGQRDLGFLS